MLRSDSDSEISSSYFSANLFELQNAISPQDSKRFGSLDSNAERIDFVLSYPQAHSLPLDEDNQMLKSSEKALQLKDVGNKYFGRGEFRMALELYSNAVLLAPRQELGVILANRSATLYYLERYNYALTDAAEAIRVGYPRELLYKIEERRAKCLLGLKRHAEAVQAFRSALKALDYTKFSLEKKQKIESDIRVMLAVMEKGNEIAQKESKGAQETQKSSEPKKTSGSTLEMKDYNPLYPSCSKAVEIRDDGGDIGRHAVATKNIEPGEILVVEKPHCAFLLAEYRLTHCHSCLSRIFVPTPAACNTCSCVAYCSIPCRDADATVHRNECTLLPTLWNSKTSITCFLALRSVTQRPFEELFALKDKLKASKGRFEVTAERPHRSDDFEAYYGLITHVDERTTKDLLHRTYIASWLLRLLKKGPYFPESVKTPDTAEVKASEGELFIGGLILQSLMLLQFNSHEISELTIPKGKKTLANAKSIFIGGGLYPTVSLFNHSCNPGIIRYYVGTTMVVRAIRSIAKGKEISENYGPIFTIAPESERKRTLRLQYWFDCQCEACTGHWPLLEEIDPLILRFKCETGPECGNVLPVRTDTNEFMIRCPKCGNNTNILKGLKALQDTDALYKTAARNLEKGKNAEALISYLEILKLLDETLALPIRDYHHCQQGVRLCMLTLGNCAYI
ncbi:SET and MYND domain-containing protein 4 [Hylaeus volcanicus]|uniref:SET and MYND domain-containing protein 4 n=1 Tax=Hylaeus volcanicus TaxID=313075 RepID=UPI0023B87723|nr:SET and MYND domain-containing protein 4 [Hylaeus volcanicus]